jgi:hypothetical protein
MKEQFVHTYKKNKWGGISKSGPGSSLELTVHIRKYLIELMKKHNIKNIFDCSCGDWYWMKEIKDSLPIYLGNDIVDELVNNNNHLYRNEKISFISGDMLSTLKSLEDKSFDFIICRHTFEHLPTDYNVSVVNEIYRVGKMALITSNKNVGNSEVDFNGVLARGINLNSEPYFSILGNNTDVYDGNNFYIFK